MPSGLDQGAAFEPQDAVAGRRQAGVVGGDDRGQAALAVHLAKQRVQAVAGAPPDSIEGR